MEIDSFVTGHHVYKRVWPPQVGERLDARRNRNNRVDPQAVGVFRNGTLVGHAPREIRDRLLRHLKTGGRIVVTVTGGRCNNRLRGLEVPAIYALVD